jgi:16S rRNA (adenine1518-N6/adenine1519-N6)-dimethyltransferase
MAELVRAKKGLGQNWLRDEAVLDYIAGRAELSNEDFVLEVGPGLGDLTRRLVRAAGRVLAIELDGELMADLRGIEAENLTVRQGDFLQFNLDELPAGYKVVANVPYYITSKIIQKLLTSGNKPARVVLLVQKEVAERLAAGPGKYSVLGIAAQVYAEVSLGEVVKAECFEPAPKVDSRVVVLDVLWTPRVENEKLFFQVVKAGFSERRKKLRSSIAGGLRMSKVESEDLLRRAGISPDLRAQDLTIEDWGRLVKSYESWLV